ncbi:hypothetical protein BS78_06G022700 [Paspalum vaginatum]|nr:hypothetical protein BS78_06G022700 [Paspalum vaginatum]
MFERSDLSTIARLLPVVEECRRRTAGAASARSEAVGARSAMAGDGWVVDIIFHTLILVGKAVPSLWIAWSSEILLAVSFGMQFVLTILAGFRWRGSSREHWDRFIRHAIWFCFVGGEYVATSAVGSLSVTSTSGERQLLAFWAPFFLLHLGGPDNITALQLEDNELSARSVLGLVFRALGATYIVYNSISGRWTLAVAAWLMLGVGVAKYAEKILALHRANLETIRRSVKKERRHGDTRRQVSSRRYTSAMLGGNKRRDQGARVLFAHSQFHICKRAIVESVEMKFSEADAKESKRFFNFENEGSYEVVEVELSLMYDFLYTKAAVIHTWHGYTVRVLSPLAIFGAVLLIEFGRKDGLNRADLVITRLLLVATFLLETASLVKALGSSWTTFLLYGRSKWGWVQHHVFCNNRRHRWLRRAIAHLLQLFKVEGHRRWSGRIGQLDLLDEITHQRRPGGRVLSITGIGIVVQCFLGECRGLINNNSDHVLDADEKDLLLIRVGYRLRKSLEGGVHKGAALLSNKAASNIKRGQKTLSQAFKDDKLYDQFRKSLGTELQVGILIWHIATSIYLFKSDVAKNMMASRASDDDIKRLQKRVKAIGSLSNYMMFLLVERPNMLPGLVLRSLYEQTYQELAEVCSKNNLQHGPILGSCFWRKKR